ncbi:MAG: hypothetical protein ACLFMX_07360 [Halobacteriales archaeon]
MSDESTRFDRVPHAADGTDTPSRRRILAWWADTFGVEPGTFDPYTFWERGGGKIWVAAAPVPDPVAVEGLGLFCLRTRGHDWKPTTNAAQRFGQHATRRVLDVDREAARRFVAGSEQAVDWDGPRGYVFVRAPIADGSAVLGVGQHLDGRLVSTVPTARRRELPW